MGTIRNKKIKSNYKDNRKNIFNFFNIILKDAFPNISAQAKIVNEEINIFD